MANNYCEVVCDDGIPCDDTDYERLLEALEVDEDDPEHFHGLSAYCDAGVLFMNSWDDEYGDLDRLPERALEVLGEIITKAGLKYWQFGEAYTCSKPRPGEFGGSKVRINADGSIEYPELVWTGGLDHYIVVGRIHGADEDSVAHITTGHKPDELPIDKFIRTVLYKVEELPEHVVDGDDFVLPRPGYTEGDDRPWAYINACYKIPGPPELYARGDAE